MSSKKVEMGLPVPKRLWLPLQILHQAGTIYTKTKLQKLAFLVQYESKIDLYDFKKHLYGPFSHNLDMDVNCYSSLINQRFAYSMMEPGNHYYEYELLPEGERKLVILEREIPHEKIQIVNDAIIKYSSMSRPKLVDAVYTKFAIKKNESLELQGKVEDEIMGLKTPISQCCEIYKNRQSTFLMSVIEIMELVSEAMNRIEDTAYRGVVFNMLLEISHKCTEAVGDIGYHTDTDIIRPKFVEIAELESALLEYCQTRKILLNPLKQPLEDTMTEDEAERVAKELSKIELPL